MKSRFINNTVCGLAVTALLLGAAGAARADGHVSLQQELRMLNERLQELEAKLAETEEKVDETRDRAILTTGKSPGSFLIPGTNTEFKIGGYVKADFIYDIKQKQGNSINPATLEKKLKIDPETKEEQEYDQGEFQAHARQSRVNISTYTPTPLGELITFIETDFYGAGGNQNQSNSYGVRLRHAYGQIAGLLFGQYWSNFGAIDAIPGTVDFYGPEGYTFIRQAQLRWTQMIDEKLKFSVSLENPEANQNFGGKFLDKLPDGTAALEYNDVWGLVRFSVLGRQLTTPDDRQEELAYGLNLGAKIAAWPGGNLFASFTFGDGIGRYLIGGVGQAAFYAPPPPMPGGSNRPVLTLREAWGLTLGANHKLTDTVMAQLAWGRYELEDAPSHLRLQAPFKRSTTLHASLFWTPLSRLTFAAEFIYYYKEQYKKANNMTPVFPRISSPMIAASPPSRYGEKDRYTLEDIENFRLMFSAWVNF